MSEARCWLMMRVRSLDECETPAWARVVWDQNLLQTLHTLREFLNQQHLSRVCRAWPVEWEPGQFRMGPADLIVGETGFWFDALPRHSNHPCETDGMWWVELEKAQQPQGALLPDHTGWVRHGDTWYQDQDLFEELQARTAELNSKPEED